MKLQWKNLSVTIAKGHYIFKGQYTLAIPVASMSLDKACKLAESVIKRVQVKTVTKRVNIPLTEVEELAFGKLIGRSTMTSNQLVGDSNASH